MARWYVHVVQLRARDVRKGDVVAKDAARTDGWFRVHEVKTLPDGSINIIDKANQRSFTGGPFDLVGLQTPVPLPAEADVTQARQRPRSGPAAPDPDGATSTPVGPAPGGDAAAREHVAQEMRSQSEQVRGSLPS